LGGRLKNKNIIKESPRSTIVIPKEKSQEYRSIHFNKQWGNEKSSFLMR
jgi:hypothetical protein